MFIHQGHRPASKSEAHREHAVHLGRETPVAATVTTPAGSATESVPGTRVLVVDDHAIVREGLKRVLESADENWAVTEAPGGVEALELLGSQRFDLAVVDISMPHMTGLEFLRRIRSEFPEMHVLILSMHLDDQYAYRAFRMGAQGFMGKGCTARELVEAARRIRAGGTYVSPELAQRMVLNLNGGGERALHMQLSGRELVVMRHLVAGKRPTEIAHAMRISVKTVSTYKSRILDRMQMDSAAALIRYAIAHDLLGDDLGSAPRD